jgi:hypothetical protein
MIIRLALRTGSTILIPTVPIVSPGRIVLTEDWWLPVFFGGNDGRTAVASRRDIVVAGLPATLVVTREAFLVAPIELMPCLARSDLLPEFVFTVA